MNREDPHDRIILGCLKMAREVTDWERKYREWLEAERIRRPA